MLRRSLWGRRGLATGAARHSINLVSNGPRTMYDKIWDDHVVEGTSDGTALLYIDRHLVHEVTSPQVSLRSLTALLCTGRHLVHEVASPRGSWREP